MNEMTIENLLKLCKVQVAKGNGNKKIILSDDDEGNGGHVMFYGFTENVDGALTYLPVDENEKDQYVVLG